MSQPPTESKSTNPLKWYTNGLSDEVFAGTVLIIAAAIALIMANSPLSGAYETLSNFHIGPSAGGFHLSISDWAQDGVLVIFFFVVGLELKNEFVKGGLSDPKRAAVPMIAAVLGMLGPILVYLLVQYWTGGQQWDGWVIPVATDIAFAVGLLGIFGKGMPTGVRTFLLTLAVVDDLLGIVLIAIVLTETINILALLASFFLIGIFAILVNRRVLYWWLLVPLAVAAWAFMFSSGVHATISGVLMGLSVPALAGKGETIAPTDRFLNFWSWISAGIVLPIFAFFAAGINILGTGGLASMFSDSISLGVMLGLPFGKFIGIFCGTALLVTFTPLALEKGLRSADLVGVSFLAGVGFTVSLLLASLSFPSGSLESAHARIGVIMGSVLSAIIAGIVLRIQVSRRRKRGQLVTE